MAPCISHYQSAIGKLVPKKYNHSMTEQSEIYYVYTSENLKSIIDITQGIMNTWTRLAPYGREINFCAKQSIYN